MDARLISYGDQFGMINRQIGNLNDRLVQMEANQETYIRNFFDVYYIPLRGYHFDSNLDGSPWQD